MFCNAYSFHGLDRCDRVSIDGCFVMDRCYQCLNYMREYKTHATNCNSTIAPCKHLMKNNIDLNLPALDKYFVYKDELACKHFEKDESVPREKIIHKRSASEKEWLKRGMIRQLIMWYSYCKGLISVAICNSLRCGIFTIVGRGGRLILSGS